MSFVKRDGRLFEVVFDGIQRNYGLRSAGIRYVVLADCVSGERLMVTSEGILDYEPVSTT